jgi:hypothetical protein
MQDVRASSIYAVPCFDRRPPCLQNVLHGAPDTTRRLHGLALLLHPPARAATRVYNWIDSSGQLRRHETTRWADVTAAGQVELVAHAEGLCDTLASVDTVNARTLAAAAAHWAARKGALAARVALVRPASCCLP